MKNLFNKSIIIVLAFILIFPVGIIDTLAENSAVTVSLSGESSCIADVNNYKVVLEVSNAAVGGVQGTLEYDNELFDFLNVTVENSIAKVNRLTNKSDAVTTDNDVVSANETAGKIDFVILSDKKSKELITFNFAIKGEIPQEDGNYFILKNVKVSQSNGAAKVETVNVTNLSGPSHKYGEWITTEEPTLFTLGQKERSCSVCKNKQTAVVEKLGASEAELKFIGATRIVLVKEDNKQYSIDGANWQSNNIFVGLTANTEYSVYSRLVNETTGEISGISNALEVTTVDIDCILGNVNADRILNLRKILMFKEIIAWADVNGDTVIDVRDIVRIKKVSAGYYASYNLGDFNEDGTVDGEDKTILSDYLNGNRESICSYLGDINADNILDINDLTAMND
jgi:hypothetical protein